jgi:cysteine desulfurase / selenocysteine lyase
MDLLASILSDEAARYRAFPITEKKLFFGHAAVSPLPRSVAEQMQEYVRTASEEWLGFDAAEKMFNETREAAAQLIHASPDEIALLGPTSLGLNLFANGINWKSGDEVVGYKDDFPANVYPWMNLREKGVELKWLQPEGLGAITPELVEKALTSKTKLVALASAHFISGFRIDFDGIGRLLRERGILFALDGIQTLGAMPTTIEHVDFLSADGHKWLLGPLGMGVVFVRKECFEICRPTLLGPSNVKSNSYVTLDEIEFLPTAARYESGALNAAGISGMKAAIDLLLSVGIERIKDRILSLRTRLKEGFQDLGFEVLGAESESGILSITSRDCNMQEVFVKLDHANVICNPRRIRDGRTYIRFSPHFYNTEEEVDRVLAVLK